MGRDRADARICQRGIRISIHAPRMGRDDLSSCISLIFTPFQSTRPVWGATVGVLCRRAVYDFISIHAPRMGRDNVYSAIKSPRKLFQSTRPVWGATSVYSGRTVASMRFQSTRPVWGATDIGIYSRYVRRISIHAPRMGRDNISSSSAVYFCDFNPRAPYGARPSARSVYMFNKHFNPRAPYGARPQASRSARRQGYFNPRAPYGARRKAA